MVLFSARRLRAAFAVVLALGLGACGQGFGDEDIPRKAAIGETLKVALGSSLEKKLATMGDEDTAEVIVSFRHKGRLTDAEIQSLRDMGLKGVYFNYLPIAGVVANKLQIQALLKRPSEIRSVFHNDQLQYDNEDARYLSSVDQTQAAPELRNANGEPLTGKGVGVLVNDSGIDGLHPDLMNRVVRNAFGHTDLRGIQESDMYPYTPTECPDALPCNTDVGGSHGTHVAGIVAGDGTASGGRFAGAAKGVNLIGFGSGATLLVLNTIGGFDYALQMLDQHPEYNLRIVTNSFGSTGDQGTQFDPEDPTNIATKELADKGVIVVFSAGNSGAGPSSITGNFKKAPWILIAANGTKQGLLAPSSSRGALAEAVYEVEVDGEILTVEDRPTVVTTGTNVISARAVAADPLSPLGTAADVQAGDLTPEQLPYYTHKTGTSMAAPHLAGLVALLLEANPSLTWREVKSIFKQTATNMPGYEPWQVGAGHANIEAAVAVGLNIRKDYGSVNHLARSFNAAVPLKGEFEEFTQTLQYLPADNSDETQFEVGPDIGLVVGIWERPDTSTCTCAVTLRDPSGKEYRSSAGLPVLAPRVTAVGTGVPGTWTLTVRGLRSLSGVVLDPTDTNGTSAPGSIEAVVQLYPNDAMRGLQDVVQHPQFKVFEKAVLERLMDGLPEGFAPDKTLTRGQMADYLMAWGVRQTRAHNATAARFADLSSNPVIQAAAEAVTRPGALILNRSPDAAPLILLEGSTFAADAVVTREEMAYALVQASGRSAQAKAFSGSMTAKHPDGRSAEVTDASQVSPVYAGYVQEALNVGVLRASFSEEGGTLKASISPKAGVSRGEYAESAVAAFASVAFP